VAFFFPLTALTSLFVHILQHPEEPSVDADISLMRLAAGHFAYLEYRAPELSFPLSRDLANLAQVAVHRARATPEPAFSITPVLRTPPEQPLHFGVRCPPPKVNTAKADIWQVDLSTGQIDAGDESWNTFLMWPGDPSWVDTSSTYD
jgi:hypothetical protein